MSGLEQGELNADISPRNVGLFDTYLALLACEKSRIREVETQAATLRNALEVESKAIGVIRLESALREHRRDIVILSNILLEYSRVAHSFLNSAEWASADSIIRLLKRKLFFKLSPESPWAPHQIRQIAEMHNLWRKDNVPLISEMPDVHWSSNELSSKQPLTMQSLDARALELQHEIENHITCIEQLCSWLDLIHGQFALIRINCRFKIIKALQPWRNLIKTKTLVDSALQQDARLSELWNQFVGWSLVARYRITETKPGYRRPEVGPLTEISPEEKEYYIKLYSPLIFIDLTSDDQNNALDHYEPDSFKTLLKNLKERSWRTYHLSALDEAIDLSQSIRVDNKDRELEPFFIITGLEELLNREFPGEGKETNEAKLQCLESKFRQLRKLGHVLLLATEPVNPLPQKNLRMETLLLSHFSNSFDLLIAPGSNSSRYLKNLFPSIPVTSLSPAISWRSESMNKLAYRKKLGLPLDRVIIWAPHLGSSAEAKDFLYRTLELCKLPHDRKAEDIFCLVTRDFEEDSKFICSLTKTNQGESSDILCAANCVLLLPGDETNLEQVFSYLQYRLPLIVFESHALKDFIFHGNTGFLYNPLRHDELAQCLSSAAEASRYEHLQYMIDAALEKCSPPRVCDNFESTINGIINTPA